MPGFVQPPPGYYYRRIYRPRSEHSQDDESRNALRATAVVLGLYARDLQQIFEVVEPAVSNMSTCGHRIRQYLIGACTEVEASWTAVLRANGYVGDRLTTRDYVKLADPLHLRDLGVQLVFYKHLGDFKPFSRWRETEPSQSLEWYDAYNQTKHDRETNLDKATLGAAIEAAGALYLMAGLQFGFEHFGLGAELGHFPFVFSAGPNLESERYEPARSSGGTPDWNAPWTPMNYPF